MHGLIGALQAERLASSVGGAPTNGNRLRFSSGHGPRKAARSAAALRARGLAGAASSRRAARSEDRGRTARHQRGETDQAHYAVSLAACIAGSCRAAARLRISR
jgi:hypothetical protein